MASHFKVALRTIKEIVLPLGPGMNSAACLLFMVLEGADLWEGRLASPLSCSHLPGGVPIAGTPVSAEAGL